MQPILPTIKEKCEKGFCSLQDRWDKMTIKSFERTEKEDRNRRTQN